MRGIGSTKRSRSHDIFPCDVTTTPKNTYSPSPSSRMLTPSTRIWLPASHSASRNIAVEIDDLPAPVRPTMPQRAPAGTLKLRPLRARGSLGRYLMLTFANSTDPFNGLIDSPNSPSALAPALTPPPPSVPPSVPPSALLLAGLRIRCWRWGGVTRGGSCGREQASEIRSTDVTAASASVLEVTMYMRVIG